MPDQVNRRELLIVGCSVGVRVFYGLWGHVGHRWPGVGIGDFVQIPLASISGNLGELVVSPILGIEKPRFPEKPVDMSETKAVPA